MTEYVLTITRAERGVAVGGELQVAIHAEESTVLSDITTALERVGCAVTIEPKRPDEDLFRKMGGDRIGGGHGGVV